MYLYCIDRDAGCPYRRDDILSINTKEEDEPHG